MAVLVGIFITISGCGATPEVKTDEFILVDASGMTRPKISYSDSSLRFDENNVTIYISDDYIIIHSHPYDVVETEDGYDIIMHFGKR